MACSTSNVRPPAQSNHAAAEVTRVGGVVIRWLRNAGFPRRADDATSWYRRARNGGGRVAKTAQDPRYGVEGRLADVIAAVTVLGGAKESEGSVRMWADRLSRPKTEHEV